MDRETAVKLWHATTGGAPITGRIVELFASAVESLEREQCAKQFVENGREIGRQEERELIAKGWDGCVHEGLPCNVDIGASIRAKRLVDSGSGA